MARKPRTTDDVVEDIPAEDIDPLQAVEEADDTLETADDLKEDESSLPSAPNVVPLTQPPVSDPKADRIVSVTAKEDLRVVVDGTATVFLLEANKARQLPYRLAMAAQVQGGKEQIAVSIDE